MKIIASTLLVVALVSVLLIVGFNRYRESQALESAGLELSRWSVKLIYSSERNINFGSASSAIFGFALPADFSGTNECGSEGYSEVGTVQLAKVLTLPDFESVDSEGCVRRTLTERGTSYIHVLLNDRVFIKVM